MLLYFYTLYLNIINYLHNQDMTNSKRYWVISPLLLFALGALISLSASQQIPKSPSSPQKPKEETIDDLIKENKAVASDIVTALKDKTKENQKIVADTINTVQNKLDKTVDVIDEIFPQLEVRNNHFLINIIYFIRDYKEIAIMVGGGLVTAFQMIFGGGLSYLTSKMKNLSGHKIKIEQGFDLQFQIYQRQELESKQPIRVSRTFEGLFQFMSLKENKEIKLILGSSGVGFTTNVKEWIRRLQEKDQDIKCLYYDMCEPLIRTKTDVETNHLQNISAIVYSLLYQEDRNFVIRLFKSISQQFFTFSMKLGRFAQRNYILVAILIATQWYQPQICFYIIFYIIVKDLIFPIFKTILDTILGMVATAESIMLKKQRNSGGSKIKIVIDNFQILRGEFQGQFKETKLKKVENRINNVQVATPVDDTTLKEHEQLFMRRLTTLFNDIAALQAKGKRQCEVILFVKNSQFYKRYLQRLKLTSANLFKIKVISQLPSSDIEFIIKQRTIQEVPVINGTKQGTDFTLPLMLFHNCNKEVMNILRQLKLDCKYSSSRSLKNDKSKQDYYADVLAHSMDQLLTHAQRLDQLLQIQPGPGEDHLKWVGLFLGCMHKKLIFFANRKESSRSSNLQKAYNAVIKHFNSTKTNRDMISSISASNRHYLFDKKSGQFAFKNDARLILMKWDELITYIEGDNNWAESLQEDFIYYYIENCKSQAELKKLDHRKYHQIYLNHTEETENKPIKENALSTAGREELVEEATKIFAKIVDFLTEKEVISDHIFFSRSVALANYYLQQKTKQKLLYEHFLMKKCKMAQKIADFGKARKNNANNKQLATFCMNLKQRFLQYLNHQAKSYEQGMCWLKNYTHTPIDCQISSQFTDKMNGYLLERTNNSYILNPFLNDVLLYWKGFITNLDQNIISDFVNSLFSNQKQRKYYTNNIKSKITVCAYWYYKRVDQEEKVTLDLLGFKFQEIRNNVQQLETASALQMKQKWIYTDMEWQSLKPLLKDNYNLFASIFQKDAQAQFNKGDPLSLKQHLHDYEKLLKEYHPDGLFKQININYRSALYSYNDGRRYRLSIPFKSLITTYYYINRKQELPTLDSVVNKLAANQKCSEIFEGLTRGDWLLILNGGDKIKAELKNRLKERDYEFRKALLFTDLKSLIAALCFTYEKEE